MLLQVLGQGLRILAVPLHAQGEGFQPLHEQEGAVGGKGRPRIAQGHHAAPSDVSRRAQGLRVHHAVIARIGGIKDREAFLICRPVKLSGIDDGAPQGRPMAADVFREGMNRDVCAVIKHPAQQRRGHGVIHDKRNAMGMGNFGPAGDIHHITLRVPHGLAEHGFGVLVEKGGGSLRLIPVNHAHFDALPGEGVREQIVGAAIELA